MQEPMHRFDILDRHQNIFCHHLIEASAGTGKTFSIENIVIRLLIERESKPISLEKILIVTFTKAATRDLRKRIRLKILECIQILESSSQEEQTPDFLRAILEQGTQRVKSALNQLKRALLLFEQGQIFTIHSFCYQMLCEGPLEQRMQSTRERPPSKTEYLSLVSLFLSTGFIEKLVSPAQLEIVLKQDVERFKRRILQESLLGPIESLPTLKQEIEEGMYRLSLLGAREPEKVQDDLLRLSVQFYQVCDRQKNIKREYQQAIERVIALFSESLSDFEKFEILMTEGAKLIKAFDPSRQKKNGSLPSLHYPGFLSEFHNALQAFILRASHPDFIMAKLAGAFQCYLKSYFEREELWSFDDILESMEKALQSPAFASYIGERYQAALIDEFQDTDPIQWRIFETLFLKSSWQGYLYLVGDPKQSIYAFRQADIYTYLEAAKSIGRENQHALLTNFRSHPALMQALNALFDSSVATQWMALPSINSYLPYVKCESGVESHSIPLEDEKKALHFFMVEAEAESTTLEKMEAKSLFPFIAEEILKLRKSGLPFRDFAILVSDRYQSQRLQKFLDQYAIPSYTQRHMPLSQSIAVDALIEFLEALSQPYSLSALKVALGGVIIAWSQEDLLRLDWQQERKQSIVTKLSEMRSIILEKGFLTFYQKWMKSVWHPKDTSKSLSEEILSREKGEELWCDLAQIAELIAEEQQRIGYSLERILDYLEALKKEEDEEGSTKKRVDPNQDGVSILTMHSSKGLEFPYVFALGVVKRTEPSSGLILRKGESGRKRVPVFTETDPQYLNYCAELDAEKMRQLYVAMTRAKERLYVASIFYLTRPSYGAAAPMELFLARWGHPICSNEKVYEKIETLGAKEVIERIDGLNCQAISHTLLNQAILSPSSFPHTQRQESPTMESPPNVYLFLNSCKRSL